MRVLISSGLGSGHLLPMLAVGHALTKRHHQVYIHTEPSGAKAIRAAGCVPLPMNTEGVAQLSQCRTTKQVIDLMGRIARGATPELLREIDRRRIDWLLVDALHWAGGLAAEKSGLPWASLASSPMTLSPAMADAAQCHLPTRAVRKAVGLSADARNAYEQALSPHLLLLPWTKDFDLGKAPRQAVHVGPLNWERRNEPRPSWLQRGDVPQVLVAVSTMPYAYLDDSVDYYVSQAIRALNEVRVPSVLTLAQKQYSVDVAPAKHVRLSRFVPHGVLMPHLKALVTHGGWGTVGRALYHGVPAVIVPFGQDQPTNARLIASRKLGVGIAYDDYNAEVLYEAVLRLLAPRSVERSNALRISKQLKKTPAPEWAARVLEERLRAVGG